MMSPVPIMETESLLEDDGRWLHQRRHMHGPGSKSEELIVGARFNSNHVVL